ncbi:major capsid protein [Thalassospira lucentensis]|uniref:major capsid protein n=1 Tax=Thalassospira lucentensis TaxID=168935 RepID=UPI003D2BB4A2
MDTYDTTDLLGVLMQFAVPDMFILDRYFGGSVMSDKSYIAMDKVVKGKKLAPFVMDTAKAKAGIREGFTTNTFNPATLKPMDVVDPERLLKRMAGEALGSGSMSPSDRRAAIIADILMDQRNDIMRRKLWMAWQVLRTGQVIVEGPEYPSQTVDFNRDPLLTKALLPADLWSNEDADILGDLENWAGDVQTKSGAVALDVIIGPNVWSKVRVNTAIDKLLNNRRGTTSSIELGPVSVNSVRNVGQIGDFNFLVYGETYQNDAGAELPYIGADEVVLTGTGIEGVQAHGAILDASAGYQPMELFPKIIVEQNPSIESVLTQSRPMIVPGNVNASLCATVL